MGKLVLLASVCTLSLLAFSSAQATDNKDYSRGLQQAKRLVSKENEPARAYLLGSRMVRNSRKLQAVRATKSNKSDAVKSPKTSL